MHVLVSPPSYQRVNLPRSAATINRHSGDKYGARTISWFKSNRPSRSAQYYYAPLFIMRLEGLYALFIMPWEGLHFAIFDVALIMLGILAILSLTCNIGNYDCDLGSWLYLMSTPCPWLLSPRFLRSHFFSTSFYFRHIIYIAMHAWGPLDSYYTFFYFLAVEGISS